MMKIKQQQDGFYHKNLIQGILNYSHEKQQIQQEIQETEKRLHELHCQSQLRDGAIIISENLLAMEISNTTKKELTAEEIAAQLDMSDGPSTINGDEVINANEQILDEENMDPEEEPEALYQFKVEDLITKTIDKMYDSRV